MSWIAESSGGDDDDDADVDRDVVTTSELSGLNTK